MTSVKGQRGLCNSDLMRGKAFVEPAVKSSRIKVGVFAI